MAEQLKNIYSNTFIQSLCEVLVQHVPKFESKKFTAQIFCREWKNFELKQRMKHIALVLHSHMPSGFHKQVPILLKMVKSLKKNNREQSFQYMFLPDYIEQFGLNDVELSLTAMEEITQFTSCEFAIRPFLKKDVTRVMRQMVVWSKHKHPSVRRFASEGCRPRLPWAMAIPYLKSNPQPIFPILENLKADSSLYVRKSVANNINDIAKDNPDTVIQLVKKWKGKNTDTDWILKHGCRTLLKKANSEILQLFGLSPNIPFSIKGFALNKTTVPKGGELGFSFALSPNKNTSTALRIEYAVYYLKANGKQTRKLFKLREGVYTGNTPVNIQKTISFMDLTTRKHYAGQHAIAIVLNGQEHAKLIFTLGKK